MLNKLSLVTEVARRIIAMSLILLSSVNTLSSLESSNQTSGKLVILGSVRTNFHRDWCFLWSTCKFYPLRREKINFITPLFRTTVKRHSPCEGDNTVIHWALRRHVSPRSLRRVFFGWHFHWRCYSLVNSKMVVTSTPSRNWDTNGMQPYFSSFRFI